MSLGMLLAKEIPNQSIIQPSSSSTRPSPLHITFQSLPFLILLLHSLLLLCGLHGLCDDLLFSFSSFLSSFIFLKFILPSLPSSISSSPPPLTPPTTPFLFVNLFPPLIRPAISPVVALFSQILHLTGISSSSSSSSHSGGRGPFDHHPSSSPFIRYLEMDEEKNLGMENEERELLKQLNLDHQTGNVSSQQKEDMEKGQEMLNIFIKQQQQNKMNSSNNQNQKQTTQQQSSTLSSSSTSSSSSLSSLTTSSKKKPSSKNQDQDQEETNTKEDISKEDNNS